MASAWQKPLSTEDATSGRLILQTNQAGWIPVSFGDLYMAEAGSFKAAAL